MLNAEAEDGHNTVHSFVLPADCAGAIGIIVPETRRCCV